MNESLSEMEKLSQCARDTLEYRVEAMLAQITSTQLLPCDGQSGPGGDASSTSGDSGSHSAAAADHHQQHHQDHDLSEHHQLQQQQQPALTVDEFLRKTEDSCNRIAATLNKLVVMERGD